MEAIKLDNGNYLINLFGKYKPNLTFISEKSDFNYIDLDKQECINKYNFIPDGSISYIEGEFFISKKGKNCFRIKKNGNHILFTISWGGCFNSTRGSVPEIKTLYERRASSNGGGTGNTYFIIDKNEKVNISEEDL